MVDRNLGYEGPYRAPVAREKVAVTIAKSIWESKPKLALAIARVALRGPVPGIAPWLAQQIVGDPSLGASRHRAAIALGALSVAEKALTGGHEFQWHRDLKARGPEKVRRAQQRVLAATDPGEFREAVFAWVSSVFAPATPEALADRQAVNARKQVRAERAQAKLDTRRYRNNVATIRLADQHLTEAVNRSLAVFTEMGSLATSAVSYWNVVAGNGAAPVASSATLMGAGLIAGLAVTAWYWRALENELDGKLRLISSRGSIGQSLKFDEAQADAASLFKKRQLVGYGIAGTLGVAGAMTGLLAATESMNDPAWQSAKFFPMLWAAYSLMNAQVSMMRSFKAMPLQFLLVEADSARDEEARRAYLEAAWRRRE